MGLSFFNRSLLRVIIVVNFLFVIWVGQSQIIDLSRPNPYQAVFVETDDFDSTYLTILSSALKQPLPDTTKFSIGNDLAYYWHTRNLDKTIALADSIYAFVKKETGEIQITLAATGVVDELLFQVNDNGIGKQNNSSAKGTGFGTELVNLLVQQLNGKLFVESQEGTTVNIVFTYSKGL